MFIVENNNYLIKVGMLKIFLTKHTFSKAKTIGVIGSGQMGTGIGIVANMVAKHNVILVDNKSAIKKSEIFVDKWLNKELDKKKLAEADVKEFKHRLRYADSVGEVAKCDFVVEVREL